MATFAYSGRTRAGQNVTGERIAESIDAAVAALRREQILVTQINPVKEAAKAAGPGKVKSKRVNAKNLAVFTRQFSRSSARRKRTRTSRRSFSRRVATSKAACRSRTR